MLRDALLPYRYTWPTQSLVGTPDWRIAEDGEALVRRLPEPDEAIARDSRWPAFFPSPICIVTATDGTHFAVEKVVGPCIVNRFPYVVALAFCRRELSARHYYRKRFMEILERGGTACVQFLSPGRDLDAILRAIADVPDGSVEQRIAASGVPTVPARSNPSPVFRSTYLAYEARLVKPGRDLEGRPTYPQPWVDVGSHRLYLLEIETLQLRRDIASGEARIHWRSLPAWSPRRELAVPDAARDRPPGMVQYQKRYDPQYVFPSPATVAFEADEVIDGFAVKHLPPLAQDQVEVDNDRARWPCFFPSSLGMITSWGEGGRPNVMPCGSTTIVSRQPLVVAACVSYARINERYAPRASLDLVRRSGHFGCGVAMIHPQVVNAIEYAGSVSFRNDPDKLAHAGLRLAAASDRSPILTDLPIHFDCQVVDEIRLGTHTMFLGEVRSIRVRSDVTPELPLEWAPWADVGGA